MKLLPVLYTSHSNAWMTAAQFTEWFHETFVPHVQENLHKLGEEPRAVLVLDNCFAHAVPEDLVSKNGKIFAQFLPPNVTALIQPMDQGVIQAVKKRYKKLLRRLIIEDDCGTSVSDFLKGVNLKVVVDLIHESWNEVTKETIRKSWNKILPIITIKSRAEVPIPSTPLLAELYQLATDDESEYEADFCLSSIGNSRGSGLWHGLRVRFHHEPAQDTLPESSDDDVSLQVFTDYFSELGMTKKETEIAQWLESDADHSRLQVLSEEEICDYVTRVMQGEEKDEATDKDNSETDEEDIPCPVTNSDAAHMFEHCLMWLEHQQEVTVELYRQWYHLS
uniref:DDE-1 domain-containing protein n=1 Tax=Amphimedon queenslandica TaxID=400682 RepID=A0A1X7UYL5_AMPQE